ncbi:MAG TPA: phenylalanine--tRNA ligase subunit alpha [Terriglobales bacterium]|nr:phenylalanine--tRNA ligase subunit alpha [Terriglobales bacterium]
MALTYQVPKLADYSPEGLDRAVAELVAELESESAVVTNEASWKEFRDGWLGRKSGVLTQVNDLWLKAAPGPQKREVGQRVNELKKRVEAVVEAARERIAAAGSDTRFESERLDISLPGIRRPLGAQHPVIRVMQEIVDVFKAMGYSIGTGPEIETDYYNFESLNFPPNHPARDMQDTIFIAGQEHKPQRDRLLLRTHTSPVQIRTMETRKPPLRIVIPGKVYRNDAPDATHSPMFHQVEGLAVDNNITFSDLKGTLDHAMKSLFGSSVKTRFRPSFFPFTEPSAEVLISCIFCNGTGYQGPNRCPNCKASGWIEMLGSGMVDPALYGFVGYDPEKVSGFAFGMGVDRLALMKYAVDDIQLFFQGDVRFLRQFA